jgi:hypothetical protein
VTPLQLPSDVFPCRQGRSANRQRAGPRFAGDSTIPIRGLVTRWAVTSDRRQGKILPCQRNGRETGGRLVADPLLSATSEARAPLFEPDNRGKNSFAAGVACEISIKNEESQRFTPLGHSAAKAANMGAKRPEQRGQKRQQGSNRVDKAVSEHTARSPFIGGHSRRIGCEFGNIFVGRDCADHLGRNRDA